LRASSTTFSTPSIIVIPPNPFRITINVRLAQVLEMAQVSVSGGQPTDAASDSRPDAHKPDPPLYDFAFNDFLRREFRYGIGVDRPVCKDFLQGHCPLGNSCPDKHHTQPGYNRSAPPPSPRRSLTHGSLVCKHWMRALCKKGDACEFLHEYNLRRMPECNNYARHGTCPNGDDCVYPHFPRAAKRAACPHYDRGFCPLGPLCARRHAARPRICPFYLAGFCPHGRECAEGAHPRFPHDLAKPVMRGAAEDEEEAAEAGDAEAKEAGPDEQGYEPDVGQDDGAEFAVPMAQQQQQPRQDQHKFGRGRWQNRGRGPRGGFRGRRG
jgi:cleavage and polyadenylation specificity factor subunit 4